MVPGPQGPQGPAGPVGGAFIHTQSTPSASWIIAHNFGRYADVACYDSSNSMVVPDVSYVDDNTVSLTFPSPVTGKVVCS